MRDAGGLVAIADGAFRFEGLSFHPMGVEIHLAMHGKEGAVREVRFAYARVSPAERASAAP